MFPKGSAAIQVVLRPPSEEEEDLGFFAIISPVAKLPKENLVGLYRYLLEKNHGETSQGRFSIQEDTVLLSAMRYAAGLDKVEIGTLVMDIGGASDHFDDILGKEFKTKRIK